MSRVSGVAPTTISTSSAGLKSATGFFRTELARRINLRITPQLTFHYDSSSEYGASISTILKSLDIKPAEDEYDEE